MNSNDKGGKCPLSPRLRVYFIVVCVIVIALVVLFASRASKDESISSANEMAISAFSAEEKLIAFTDSLGQEITIPQPKRVVSLMGSFTEIWLLAGGKDTLVGTAVDTQDKRDMGLPETVVNVGTYQSPNLEAILAAEPDLVLLSSETVRTDSHVSFRNSLEAAGIPAAYFSVTHFPDYLNMLEICCRLTGNQQAYEENGHKVEAEVKEAISYYKVSHNPTALVLITFSGGVRPQASTTMTGGILAELGAKNIIDDYPSLLKDFSMEKVIEIDPDYIFAIPMGYTDEEAIRALTVSVEENPAWNVLTAVKNKRYHPLPPEKFMFKPNNRWAESYRYLGEFLKNNPTDTND
ncbi:MAG: ABC transporter substrate-binding protein [Spirochaetaceae bacterium]|nr:ABC transporter substrate-binding protein [Spirochaetaceae bacterium]